MCSSGARSVRIIALPRFDHLAFASADDFCDGTETFDEVVIDSFVQRHFAGLNQIESGRGAS
jgi:hypothetical protein